MDGDRWIFLQMGGFVVQTDETWPSHPLSADELEELDTLGWIHFPAISEEEIMDKSKGDLLSKGIVPIQTTWFIAQCIACGIQGLVITELEPVTLAFAVLNGMMYYAWWKKPLDVHYSVPVYWTTAETHATCKDRWDLEKVLRVCKEEDQSSEVCSSSKAEHLCDLESTTGVSIQSSNNVPIEDDIVSTRLRLSWLEKPPSFRNAIGILCAFVVDKACKAGKAIQRFRTEVREERLFRSIWFLAIYRPAAVVLRPIGRVTAAEAKAYCTEMDANKVPTFYAMKLTQEVDRRLDLISSAVAVLFGIIHCIK